jgi:hypothetical protein
MLGIFHTLALCARGRNVKAAGRGSRQDSRFDVRLIVQNDAQQRAVHFHSAVVINEAQLPKFVHEIVLVHSGGPSKCWHALSIGTRSAQSIRASGETCRINRPDT